AGLVDTLQSPGPFTVFAPTNDAFAKLPAGTGETLLKPQKHDSLKKMLAYHCVAGQRSAARLVNRTKTGKGCSELCTVQGGKLWATLHMGKHIMLKDEKGGEVLVTIPDVFQSNGVIHVVDGVLLPN